MEILILMTVLILSIVLERMGRKRKDNRPFRPTRKSPD